MSNILYTRLTEPTIEVVDCFNRWENDPDLIPLIRPNKNQEELERRSTLALQDMAHRLKHHQTYLIFLEGQLVGEVSYEVDPEHLYKKERGTAWVSITIGEPQARGQGIGFQAMQFLETQIKLQGLRRIELGVFAFNTNAIKLYQKLAYQEIGRIESFTYWQGKLWQDIRMEKYLPV